MEKIKLLLIPFLILISLTFISGAKVITTSDFGSGLTIQAPEVSTIKSGDDFTFNFHIFNSTNGVLLTNDSVNCSLHLYNSSGIEIFNKNNLPYVSTDFYQEVKGNNFTVGTYSYITQCESNLAGGYVSVGFEVIGGGAEPTVSQAIMYGVILFIILILFLGSFIWFNSIQWGHYTSSEGNIVKVNTERTKKVLLFFSSYILFLFLSFIGKSMAENFMFIDETPVFFDILFTILLVSIAPVTIAISAIIILTTIADSKLQEAIFRGLEI